MQKETKKWQFIGTCQAVVFVDRPTEFINTVVGSDGTSIQNASDCRRTLKHRNDEIYFLPRNKKGNLINT